MRHAYHLVPTKGYLGRDSALGSDQQIMDTPCDTSRRHLQTLGEQNTPRNEMVTELVAD